MGPSVVEQWARAQLPLQNGRLAVVACLESHLGMNPWPFLVKLCHQKCFTVNHHLYCFPFEEKTLKNL